MHSYSKASLLPFSFTRCIQNYLLLKLTKNNADEVYINKTALSSQFANNAGFDFFYFFTFFFPLASALSILHAPLTRARPHYPPHPMLAPWEN